MLTCPKCNSPLKDDAIFCENCGIKVNKADQAPQPAQNIATETVASTKDASTKKEFQVKNLAILGGALAVILILAFIIFGNGSSSKNQLLYLKENEIMFANLKKKEPIEITEDLLEDDRDSINSWELSNLILMNDEENLIFYPDNVSYDDEGISLYYKNLKKDPDEEYKIDSDIKAYKINKSGTKVFYIKGDDGDLYVSDLDDEEKIDDEVTTFYIDDAGNRIIYVNYDGDIYIKDGKDDEERVDKNSRIISLSDDLSKIYYLKDDDFYVKSIDKDEIKIDSDVSDVINVFESGECYYLKSKETESTLYSLVDDDMVNSDKSLTEPIEPKCPSYYDYEYYEDGWIMTDWDAYDKAVEQYDREYDKYYESWNAYQDKLDRDYLREDLKSEVVQTANNELYYYNGSESELVTEYFGNQSDYSYEKAVLAYKKYDKLSGSKPKLSEIYSEYDVYDYVENRISVSPETYIAIKGTEFELDEEDVYIVRLSFDGTKLYYLADYSHDKGNGDLYIVSINNDSLDEAVLHDEDVYNNYSIYSDDLVYFKNVKEYTGTLYINDSKIESDVYIFSVYSVDDSGYIYYSDWDPDDAEGTLVLYNGKDSDELIDGVHNHQYFNKKLIAYIGNYDVDDQEGDLYLFNGSDKPIRIDRHVTDFLYTYVSSSTTPVGRYNYSSLFY